MRRFRISILGCVIATALCFSLAATDGQRADVTGILKLFPGWHLLTLQERDPDLRAFLVRHFPTENAALVRADFNGDGSPDYAVLLRDNKSNAAKLVVLLCSTDEQCKSVYEADETTNASSVYLRPISTGSKVSQTEAINDKSSALKLRSTGVQVTYFEKATVVLYWNGKLKKIQEVQTED